MNWVATLQPSGSSREYPNLSLVYLVPVADGVGVGVNDGVDCPGVGVADAPGDVVTVDELLPSPAHATTTSSMGTPKNTSLRMVWTDSPSLDTLNPLGVDPPLDRTFAPHRNDRPGLPSRTASPPPPPRCGKPPRSAGPSLRPVRRRPRTPGQSAEARRAGAALFRRQDRATTGSPASRARLP